CAALTASRVHAQESRSREYEAAYFEARLAMEMKDYDAAKELFGKLTEREDCPPEAFTALAECQLESNDIEGSLATLGKAIEREPKYVPAWQMRSNVYRRKSDLDKAIADLEKALELEPKNAEMLDDLGRLMLRSVKTWTNDGGENSSIGKLVSVYTRLLEVRSGSDRVLPLLVLTSIHTRLGNLDKSIEYAKEAVRIRPQDIRGHLALAETYEAAGRKPEALAAYRQAMLIEPNNDGIKSKIVELINSTGAPGGLLAFYEDLAKSFPRVLEIQEAYGDELIKGELWEKVAAHFEAAIKNWPENHKFKSALIRCYFGLGKQDQALAAARGLISDPQATDREMLELAVTLRGAGELDLVIDLMKKIAESHPEEYRLTLQLAGVQIQAGKIQDAISTLGNLTEKRPDVFPAVAMLGALYTDSGKIEQAQALYDRVLPSTPKDRLNDLQMLRAQLYRQQFQNDKAVDLLEAIVNQTGEIPDLAVQMLVEIYAGMNAYDKAHKTVDKYIAGASEGNARVGKRLKAWLHWRAKEYPKSIEILEALNAAQPDDFEIVRFLTENYTDAKLYEKAQGLVAASEKLFDDKFKDDLSLLRARIYKDQGQFDEAVKVVEALLGENDKDERILLIAGEYYNDAGRIEDAERVLRKAIEVNPNNSETYNALGYFFAEAGIKLDEAEKLVGKALELNPGAAHILDSLGWVYYKQGNFQKAVETLERAVSKMKDAPDPTVIEHLGDAYSKKGDAGKAHQLYEQGLKLSPESEKLRQKLVQ
ncbi:tetratricopeptide repeat protein, partial [Candidatus Sumerlaeota bacterium]|nr:tetratricopeptide repeat protein [Candidatus Sumerlaeota bacterium]